MKIISSYPRSGSAKLKLIICNILYPDVKHDFHTINHYVPSIDNKEILNNCAKNVEFLCTHSNIRADIYLYRHVGDVLISEYWYKRKYYPEFQSNVHGWIKRVDYGEGWRRSIEAGRGCENQISYDDLDDPGKLAKVLGFKEKQVIDVLPKCSFDEMLILEKESQIGGISRIPYMRMGTSGQWKNKEWSDALCRANESELLYLKLTRYNDQTGRYEDY